jgi:general secretion pathway protein B
MSFILDALRKSDTQRQEQAGPGLATTPQQTRKKTRSVWIPLLVGVLVLNALVMGWVLLNDPETNEQIPAATSANLDDGAGTRSPRKEALPTTPASTPPTPAAAVTETTRTTPVAEPEPVVNVAAAEDAAAPPSFQQLLIAGILSMPNLHLDIHVYAGERDKRFVFINGDKYREGERLSDGPIVETITLTGVILTHQGNRFTLERD